MPFDRNYLENKWKESFPIPPNILRSWGLGLLVVEKNGLTAKLDSSATAYFGLNESITNGWEIQLGDFLRDENLAEIKRQVFQLAAKEFELDLSLKKNSEREELRSFWRTQNELFLVAVWREKTAEHKSAPTPAFPADLHRIAIICFDRDQKVCSVNEPFTQLTGYTMRDIPSLDKWQAKLGNLSASLSDELDTAHFLNSNAALQKNLKILRTKEGKSLIVEESHFFYGIHHFWTYLDVSDHWQIVEELEKQKQYIDSILSALPDLLFIIDRDGRFIETKSGQLDNLAIPLEQFAHKKISEVLPNPFADRLMASIVQCIADKEPTAIQYDLPINGVIRDFEARIAPFGSDRVVVLARDISASKNTERSLKKTKEFLEQAGRMAQVGAFEYFPATRQLNWSSATREIHEVPDDFIETIENAPTFFEKNTDRSVVFKAWNNALCFGENADFEATLLTFSGKKKWVRVIINSELEEGKCVRMYGTMQDITERKKTLEKQQQFISEAPSAMAMLDTQMRYLAYSKKWIEDYQITDKDILGKSHYEVFPEIGEEWRTIHTQALTGQSFGRDEDRFERADGSVNYMKWKINPWYDGEKIGGLIMLTENVTNEKVALNSQRRLSKIVEESVNEIYVFDKNLTITHANKAATKNLGYSIEELTGMRITDLLEDISPSGLHSTYLDSLSSIPDQKMTLETLHRRKDRSLYPVQVNFSKLASDGEEFFVSIALDITERINHIRAIEEQNRILKDIAWMQSHVVRAPLSRMMMLLSLLENKDIVYGEHDLLKSREEVIQSVKETAEEIDRIISDISTKTKTLNPSLENEEAPTPAKQPSTDSCEFWLIDEDELSQLVNRYTVIQHGLSERPRQFHEAEEALEILMAENQPGRSFLILLDLQTLERSKTNWLDTLISAEIKASLAIITMDEQGKKNHEPKGKANPYVVDHVTKPLKKSQIERIKKHMREMGTT
ncbi:hypothetical protein ADIS_1044 [Lunatimonas lonarensis]|uniref:histidine kinase n=1 Tax=Lunatimonas lonarensis TaxID=1232681 RepID=R7ZWN6_9BACT|nr:PAS domain-containing protein [Lunatimonas lonarensis]EON78433.1 hypothetical protein ADIS_1044 [Lunatimonas lonarensis]